MENRFDVVTVRANDERSIVVAVILRAQTRRTVVFASCVKCGAIEGFDLLAILGREGQVEMRCLLLNSTDAQ